MSSSALDLLRPVWSRVRAGTAMREIIFIDRTPVITHAQMMNQGLKKQGCLRFNLKKTISRSS